MALRAEGNMKKHQRFLAMACVIIMAASLNGCASFGVVPHQFAGQERPNYGHIGVVAARFQPQVQIDVLTSGKGAGAAKGAGKGAIEVAIHAYPCLALLYPPAIAVCYAVFVTGGATVGAVVGAVRTESAEKIVAVYVAMKNRLEDFKLQETVRDAVVEYAREVELPGFMILKDQGPEDVNALPVYRPATGERLDTVVELSLLNLEAEVTGAKGNLILIKTNFRVRLVNASDGKILDSFTHQFSAGMSSEEWFKDNARMITDMIHSWYREFAEIVVDEIFLNYRPVAEVDGKTVQQEVKKTESDNEQLLILSDYVLKPLYPEVQQGSPFGHYAFGWLKVLGVDSPEPTFRWEALPKLRELREASAGARITDVKYDLRIFNSGYFLKAFVANKQIYQVTGLTEPKFKLSGFFQPCQVYFWTVRARFLLDGKRQATEWSGTYYNFGGRPWWWRRNAYPPLASPKAPNRWYYLPFSIPRAWPAGKCP
jgi:hypothetical protein